MLSAKERSGERRRPRGAERAAIVLRFGVAAAHVAVRVRV